jgi:sulfoacetaldehyde acetyltransferase
MKQKMTPSEALVETLVAEGVEHAFGIVGSAYMDALDLFPDAGADGLARVTGKPQICIAQNGPGAANFVSAIAAAYWAHSPVVAITPETGSGGIGTGGFQELDQMDMFRQQTIYQVRVNRPDRIAELTRRAFYLAKLENGPTQLNIPRDYFYGECEEEIYASPTIQRGPGPMALRVEAAKLLAGAKYPVILAGGGVSQGDALAEAEAIAEYLTAPVCNTYLHNDSFRAAHPLAMGPIGYCGSKAAMRTIAKADVVLALGTRLGPFGTLPQYDMQYWPTSARIIQIDLDAKVLGLSQRVDLAICADVKEFAAELLSALRNEKQLSPNQARLAELEKDRQVWAEELESWSTSESKLMHPRRFIRELSRAIPEGSIVTTDIGNNSSMCNAYLRFSDVRQHLAALTWGNCGFGYGAALGAKLGRPEAPVFAFQGDGAWGISGIAEVMTAVREEIPVIAIVANNLEWGAEKKNQVDYYGSRFVGTNLRENPDFAQVAEAMGAKGYKVEDWRHVGDAVRDAVASNRPCVINAVIEGGEKVLAEPFRRDALKMPTRYLAKYKHLGIED